MTTGVNSLILCSGALLNFILNRIVAVDLIQNQDQPHGKCPVKTRLKAQREDVLAKHDISGGIYFASDLSHRFLHCIQYRARSGRKRSFYLVLLTWIPTHFHRHGTPSDHGCSPHTKYRIAPVCSFPYVALPPLMQTRPLCVQINWFNNNNNNNNI